MRYREIGKTGLEASIIGLGCEHLDGKPYELVNETISEALSCGINMIDLFMPGSEVRKNIRRAIGEKRDQVMIQGHIGSTDLNQQYDISRNLPVVKQYFEEMLRIFGYIDFGMMFFIDSEQDYKDVFETEFIDYVQQLKRQGDIRHIGFSSHNPVTAKRVVETGVPELMMFSINPAFDLLPAQTYALNHLEVIDASAFQGFDPLRASLYQLCQQRGVGITVMKTLGAGKLISREHTPFQRPLTVAQCIHYALNRPAVASALLGCKSKKEVREAVDYLNTDDADLDYAAVLGTLKNDFRGNCVYCSHCQPCPVGIDIAAVNKYLDIAKLDTTKIPPSISSHYHSLEHKGNECVGCMHCESRCPFGVPVAGNMAEAVKLFGE